MGDRQPGRIDAFLPDEIELLERHRAELGVRMDRRAGLLVRVENGEQHLGLGLAHRVVAGAELDHAALDVGAVHALGNLGDDMAGELGAALCCDPLGKRRAGAGASCRAT